MRDRLKLIVRHIGRSKCRIYSTSVQYRLNPASSWALRTLKQCQEEQNIRVVVERSAPVVLLDKPSTETNEVRASQLAQA